MTRSDRECILTPVIETIPGGKSFRKGIRMKSSKFFRFTVEGDNLNPDRVRNEIDLPAEVFFKNVPAVRKICGKERVFPQKTNRWVYSCDSIDGTHPETFLTKNLQVLRVRLSIRHH